MARSIENPLAPPVGMGESAISPVLRRYCDHFGLSAQPGRLESLVSVVRAFVGIPYENLTKILSYAESGTVQEARRLPLTVVEDHIAHGAGGTCFSLTATLLHLVRALGWQAEPILADRHYGANTHSALLVWVQGQPRLLDPGYLIVEPLSLPTATETNIRTAFNELALRPREDGRLLDLFTIHQRSRSFRLTYKVSPADPGEFLRAWHESFESDMMRYPVLTQVTGGKQLYLQKNRLQIRGFDGIERGEVDPASLVERIADEFGIAPRLAERALSLLKKKGEPLG